MEKRETGLKLSLEESMVLLMVDYRWSMIKNGKVIIKLIRDVDKEEIYLLKKIGFKEEGKTWCISVEIIEEYLNNRCQMLIEKFDSILKENNINDAKVEFYSPFFSIKSSNNEQLCEIFKKYDLRARISNDIIWILAWDLPF